MFLVLNGSTYYGESFEGIALPKAMMWGQNASLQRTRLNWRQHICILPLLKNKDTNKQNTHTRTQPEMHKYM